MGYTHYWNADLASLTESVTLDMIKVIEDRDHGVPYQLNIEKRDGRTHFELNGREPYDHEPFVWPPSKSWDFCKTAQKPYDTLVVACLAIAASALPGKVRPTSDGFRHEWAAGVALASRVLGRDVSNPIENESEAYR